jgi:sterol desaturase/sphingolipid hydroxylase (fatty acid hydroxylase superfamily)
VVVLWAPVVLACAWHATRDRLLSGGAAVGMALIGVLAWTLLEYVLHRWVFHFPFSGESETQRDVGYLIHGVHHDYPWDRDRLVMPPLLSIPLALLLGEIFWHLLGAHAFFPFFAGLVAGYVWYDLSHYAIHHRKPRTALGRYVRQHHLVHHFGPPGQGYGVTSPLWDLVLGTMPRSRRAVSPSHPSSR